MSNLTDHRSAWLIENYLFLAEQGMPDEQIARRLCISKGALQKELKRKGVR